MALLFLPGGLLPAVFAAAPPFEQRVHDPSTIVKEGDTYRLFATGRGILSLYSRDLVHWERGPRVLDPVPPWTAEAVPGSRDYFWAPDVIRVGACYLLYYSVSTWGSQTSAIGLATNATLDSESPQYRWVDQGIVIQSARKDPYNAIDPSVMQASNGKLWLAFGSFWGGIFLTELDPATGKRLDTNSAPVALAWKDAIEAACLYQRGDEYYLFVNWGQCCRGTNSTYNIRVGRSRSITGPYLDRQGKSLVEGGGTLVLETSGRFIGPGHAGILREGGTNWFSFHFYDRERGGQPTLGLRRLEWSTDGWPKVDSR